MKKITSIIMAIIMAVTICACGAKEPASNSSTTGEDEAQNTVVSSDNGASKQPQQDGSSTEVHFSSQNEEETEETDPAAQAETDTGAVDAAPQQESATAEADAETDADGQQKPETAEDENLDEDMEKLSALGDVEVENGILLVTITVPAGLAGEITQEELDASKGTYYQSAVLNEDGSVTYKMTKAQHRAMLDNISSAADEGAQELIDDNENYTISAITHNADCTVFDVTLDGTEIGFGDAFASYTFFMYGALYGIFNGQTPEHVIANFYDPDGNLIDSYDSADMQDPEGTEESGDYENAESNTY